MSNLLELPSRDEKGRLRVVVETPKGSGFKIHYEPATGTFSFQRSLQGLRYPHDWGFVPGTRAEDGDPLDALLLHEDQTWPGILFPCTPLAVLKIREQKAGADHEVRNDRLIAVPCHAAALNSVLSPEKKRQLEEFFQAVGAQGQKRVRLLGWGDSDEAWEAVEQAKK